MLSEKVDEFVAGKQKSNRKLRMLYEECVMCCGNGRITNPHNCAEDVPCLCEPLRVVVTGLTEPQACRLAELDNLRQMAGISAAMLLDGRASAFRDLVIACQRALAAYDAAHAQNGMATWTGADVDHMRAAIAKATKGEAFHGGLCRLD